jgi:hypothetical protein
MNLKRHYERKEGITEIARIGESPLKHLEFSIMDLFGNTLTAEFVTGENECA